ncbi:MAG: hypothetical protein IPP72_18445 [Chitinophagaceae bacterium]|nr:hypothetical protein [Chitinophagaceae bacterium]
MLKLSIPKPCHEDWDTMIPNEQGRHCNACVKTVVDFTAMSDEEVNHFFIKQQGQSVCGRFKNEQLHRISITLPHNIYQITMPRWKQFLAALLLAFCSMLFSCDALIGKSETIGDTLAEVEQIDTTIPPSIESTLGITRMQVDYSTQPVCSTTTGDTVMMQGITQGVTVVQEPEPVFPETVVEPAMLQPDSTQLYFMGKPLPENDSIQNGRKIDSATCENENSIHL